MNMYLEHANITVHDIDKTIRFLQTAFPNFAIRGQGKSGDRRWLHIGTDTTYVALNDATVSKNKIPHKDYDGVGINHIGFVVENVNDIARRLEEKGYQASYPRTEEKYRTRIYYYDDSGIEYEFVEYFSEEPEKRNLYSQAKKTEAKISQTKKLPEAEAKMQGRSCTARPSQTFVKTIRKPQTTNYLRFLFYGWLYSRTIEYCDVSIFVNTTFTGGKTMAKYYYFHNKADISTVGGKAIALMETTAHGFPVPPGFVLSVDFFLPWLEQVKQSAEWESFLQIFPRDFSARNDVDNLLIKEKCDAIKKIPLLFSTEQQKVLHEAFETFDDDNIFAVRSSSPEEDLQGSSFAGGYETTLGVTRVTLEDAICISFRSLFDARIVHYKIQHSIAVDAPRIAVIVQKQIASEASGVAFSLNPQNNCYDEAVINANFGLGETVVAGQVTPDTYVVDKVHHRILQQKIVEKSHSLWLQRDGGVTEMANENPSTPSLTNDQVTAIADLVARCEKHYGQPMDIEWAITNEQLYLLQSRPITTYLPLFPEMITKPGEQKSLYMDVIILSQGFSESFSVLGLEIWGKMLQKAKGLPEGKDGVVWNIHGRQYFHLSNMLRGFGKSYAKVISQYERPIKRIFAQLDIDEYIPSKKLLAMKGFKWKTLKRVLKLLPSICAGIFRSEKTLQKYKIKSKEVYTYCKSELQKDKPFAVLVDEGLRYFSDIIMFAGVLIAPVFARWRLGKIFKNDNVDDLLVALNMDLPGNPTSEMGHLMLRLAAHPEIRETASAQQFVEKWNNREYSTEFLQAYTEYMEKFGCRGMREIDIASPRSYEDKKEFFRRLKHINVDDNAINSVKERREQAYNQLLAIAKKRGKEKKFRHYAKIQHSMAGYREHPKYIYIVAVDMLRRRALKLGEMFVEQGRLQNVDQIFDLTIAQITQAQQNRDIQLLPLIKNNLLPYATVKNVKDWPKLFDSRGKILRAPRDDHDGMIGDPISPGIVRGKAKVLHSPYEKPLAKGEILVTRATEPSWTPIFINAAAVVLEVGGPLQHGAIIAREYGIPCVSGLENITALIKDGDELQVDGCNGTVKILCCASDKQGVSSIKVCLILKS